MPSPLFAIDNPTDPRLDDYRNVPDPELLEARGIFVAEGRLVVRRLLLDSPLRTRSVMLTDAAQQAMGEALGRRPDVPVYVVPPTVMNDITGFNIHRGCLAIGERPQTIEWTQIVSKRNAHSPKPKMLVVLERVANADNVGGIVRNAAAFGAGAVLLDPMSTDPLYRKAIRTSMGAALVVPFARAEPWPAALHELDAIGFVTVALTPAASAADIRSTASAVGGRPVALLLGHEGDGLTPQALAACQYQARIPIASTVDSLNVSAAAAIALHEFGQA